MLVSNNAVRRKFFLHAKEHEMKSYIGNDLLGETEATFHFHVTDKHERVNTYMSATIEGNECYCIELISFDFGKKDYKAFVKFVEMLISCCVIINIELDYNSPAVHIAKKLFKQFNGMYRKKGGMIEFMWVKEGANCF